MLKTTLCIAAVAVIALASAASHAVASAPQPAAAAMLPDECDGSKQLEECKELQSPACQQLLALMKSTGGAVSQAFAILCGKGGGGQGNVPAEVCADLAGLIPDDTWLQICGKKKIIK